LKNKWDQLASVSLEKAVNGFYQPWDWGQVLLEDPPRRNIASVPDRHLIDLTASGATPKSGSVETRCRYS
jgi:hypothetical protein